MITYGNVGGDPNPYNLPTPAEGAMAAIPNEVILQMDNDDDTGEQLEEIAETSGMTGGTLNQEEAQEDANNSIVDY